MTDDRRFKVLEDGRPTVPWSFVAPHEKQAQTNHSQTLQRLHERGGLGWDEMLAVVTNRKWYDLPKVERDNAETTIRSMTDVR